MAREVAQVLGLALGQAARGASVGSRVAADARRDRAASGVAARRRAATTKRSQIVCAALTEICWPTIARASVVNGSPRRCRWTSGMRADQLASAPVALAERARRVVPVRGLQSRAVREPRPRRAARAGSRRRPDVAADRAVSSEHGREQRGNGTLRRFHFRGSRMLRRIVGPAGPARGRRSGLPPRSSCRCRPPPPIPNKVLRDRVSHRRKPASIRSASRISTRTRSTRRSSSAC